MSRHKFIKELYEHDPDYQAFESEKNASCKKHIDNIFTSCYENYFFQNIHLLDLVKKTLGKSKEAKWKPVLAGGGVLLISPFVIFISAFIHFIVIITKILRLSHRPTQLSEPLSIAFCSLSLRKLDQYSKATNKNFTCIYDDIRLPSTYSSDSQVGIMQSLRLRERLKLLFSYKFASELIRNIIGYFRVSKKYRFSLQFLIYFSKRFGVDSFTWGAIEECLTSLSIREVYSASTNERYAIFLKRLCKSKSINAICIPHGFSPILLLPDGVFGDTYYAINRAEKNYLRKNYPSNNYLFEEELALKLFRVSAPSKNTPKRIVYCTTSRHREADQECIDLLCARFDEIYVKLHPIDKVSDYKFPNNASIIESYIEAISGNILVTKPSTMLVDGTYNDSLCIMLLDDPVVKFDYRFIYPGVRTESTLVANNLHEAMQILETEIGKDVAPESVEIAGC